MRLKSLCLKLKSGRLTAATFSLVNSGYLRRKSIAVGAKLYFSNDHVVTIKLVRGEE